MKTSHFAYAQARVQARFARLPADEDWERLVGVRGLASFLEEARGGALRDWVKPFSGQSDSHDVEVALRNLYREHVAEVAAWVPVPWQSALLWMRWLVAIPLFDHLARGGAMPAWANRDLALQGLLNETGEMDPERVRRAGASVLLVSGSDPATAWLTQWRQCWPRRQSGDLRNLARLEGLIARHLHAFRCASPASTWALRRRLRGQLALLFHQCLLQPAGVFVYLILVLLDLERLRSELVGRALFSTPEAA